MCIAESRRLRQPLEYYQLFGEKVHYQIALKWAYLKAMLHQFCCMFQALGKSPNQSTANLRCLWSVASIAFSTFIAPILYLMWIYWKWRTCCRLMCSLKGTNRAAVGIPCEKMSLQWPDKLCYGILWMLLVEERGDPTRCGDELWKGRART